MIWNEYKFSVKKVIEALVASWVGMLILSFYYSGTVLFNREYSKNFSIVTAFILIALLFLLIILLDMLIKSVEIVRLSLLLLVSMYMIIIVSFTSEITWLYAAVLIELLLVYYLRDTDFGIRIRDKYVFAKSSYAILFLLVLLFIGGYTVMKYLAYRSPNFDFGIFANMYHNMKEGFKPLVTSERDKVLSHFAVHFSPIVYVALPIYCVFPDPATVQVIQALALAVGVIPIYLISKHHGLGKKTTVAIGILYFLYPALAGGCAYDFHENCFLVPTLLFLFWAMEKKNNILIILFGLLACMVKEDAPVYVAIIGIYYLCSGKSKLRGSLLTIASVIYFVVVTSLMQKYGLGVMTYRYSNIVPYGVDGFGAIIKAAMSNPMLLISECFTAEKMQFAFYMLMPIAGLSFANKKVSNFILVGPFLLINLISDYQYQHSIFFQYTFGVTAIFFYLVIVNLKEMKPIMRRNCLRFAMVASLTIFVFILPRYINYFNYYSIEKDKIEELNEALEMIPDDASVSASTFLVAKLSEREFIYEYPSDNETEYIVLDHRWSKYSDVAIDNLKMRGYEVVYDGTNVLILKLK
ncbi:MAG: DUF2079 domain-containing protein [Lachnospiraceae bacterium]|nr:DUF2079 domain-containing protein [Lachnospiraceae bacterium]